MGGFKKRLTQILMERKGERTVYGTKKWQQIEKRKKGKTPPGFPNLVEKKGGGGKVSTPSAKIFLEEKRKESCTENAEM